MIGELSTHDDFQLAQQDYFEEHKAYFEKNIPEQLVIHNGYAFILKGILENKIDFNIHPKKQIDQFYI